MSAPDKPLHPPELNQLQRWFQSVITHADGVEAGISSKPAQRVIPLEPGALERVITRSRALSAAERLAIYANAYHSRLLECLGEVFPMLKRTLGEDGFDGLAFGYLQDYPSQTYTLNELGRHFPGYLEQTRPVDDGAQTGPIDPASPGSEPVLDRDWPAFLIDLARLEWAIYEVFDGEGVEGLALLQGDQILSIPTERRPEAKLTPVVCLRLLDFRFPVNEYFSALRQVQPDEPVPIPAAKESFVALTRRDFVVRRYPLSAAQFELLKALKNGLSVKDALERVLTATPMDGGDLTSQLMLWFRNWTAEGFFQSVSLDA